MTEAVAEPRSRPSVRLSPWLLLSLLSLIFALGYLGISGVRTADSTQDNVRLIPDLVYDERVDFNYFYSGAKMALNGDAADLYPVPGELTWYPYDPVFENTSDDYALARLLARGNYYNPPALAFLQAPLAALNFKSAYWTFTGLSMAALGGFILVAWRAGRGIPELPLLVLGVLSFRPVHEALIMGHSPLFFCLALAAGFLLLRSRHEVLAGLCFSLLALKPQWAILPGLFLVARGEWRTLVTMGVASALIFFVPFFVTGLDTLEHYLRFLRQQQKLDIKDAPHMFSWNGFLFKLTGGPLEGHTPPAAGFTYALIALTGIPLAVVWWGRNYLLGVAATVVAMLLVSTHSVWYDWSLLIIAGLFVLLYSRGRSRAMRVEMWAILLAVHIAASQSIGALLEPDRYSIAWHTPALYLLTPVTFAALSWMALLTLYDRETRSRFTLPRRLRPARIAGS